MSSEVKANKVSPATGTDFTFGDSGDTFTVPSGATLAVTGATVTGLSAGKVLQVLSTAKTNTFSRTASSGDYGDVTGLTVAITPSSTSNKILVMVSLSCGGTGGQEMRYKIVRDSTDIFIGDAADSQGRGSGAGRSNNGSTQEVLTGIYLDSPSSTSALTYKIQIGGEGSVAYRVNWCIDDADNNTITRTASSITVMEIEG